MRYLILPFIMLALWILALGDVAQGVHVLVGVDCSDHTIVCPCHTFQAVAVCDQQGVGVLAFDCECPAGGTVVVVADSTWLNAGECGVRRRD